MLTERNCRINIFKGCLSSSIPPQFPRLSGGVHVGPSRLSVCKSVCLQASLSPVLFESLSLFGCLRLLSEMQIEVGGQTLQIKLLVGIDVHDGNAQTCLWGGIGEEWGERWERHERNTGKGKGEEKMVVKGEEVSKGMKG